MNNHPGGFPFVSVIVPCRNERQFIIPCLESILSNDYPKEHMEVLVVDGESDDGSRALLESFASAHSVVRLIANANRTTPTALNLGIRESRGEIVVRMDAHTSYPSTYISSLVHWLEKSGADNVGGVCVTMPANSTAVARAIALGQSHPFGVGNSYFRIGTSEPRWVDTVPFGCYRRSVFDKVGFFDEELVRNQDDEMNLRIVRAGGRHLLVPQIVTYYYARETLGKLWRMYYQYGYFKALVFRKHGMLMTWRQTVPAIFVSALFGSAALALLFPLSGAAALAIVAAYLATNAGVSARALRKHGIVCSAALFSVFVVLHFSYGFGTLKGLVDFFVLRREGSTRTRATTITR